MQPLLIPGARKNRYTADSSTVSLLSQSHSVAGDNPYPSNNNNLHGHGLGVHSFNNHTISDKYSLSADPATWGSNLYPNVPEPDDALHSPDARKGKYREHSSGSMLTRRGMANLGCLALLLAALLTLFIGFPILKFIKNGGFSGPTALNVRVNGTGQIPKMSFGIVDPDTPQEAYTTTSYGDGSEWKLVFSDEFNTEGRSFYPGDDPYWEAVNLNYWETSDLEWYDPSAITTTNGSLVITFSKYESHNLSYQGGMMSTWNKFCFTGGYFEASVMLPGINNVAGMWPAVWTLGNLGRAGYGATLDGLWPYTYDSCDVGTAPNQTINGKPEAATVDGDSSADFALSYLSGQRLSRCTCPGESHPGPIHSQDGSYVGRSAPEIDMFEAQVTGETGQVSQSAQWAPFNDKYIWLNTSANLIIPDPSISALNSYIGGDTQQASSVVTSINQDCYELSESPCYNTYGFEYVPGFDDAYITWIANGKQSWTLNVAGMGADNVTEIAARPIPQEPMYLIINLGMSESFSTIDFDHLTFPNHLRVDYVRVYQDPNNINIGCDPEDFPTADYINTYIDAYTNPNYTTWVDDFKQPWPKNKLLDSC